MENATYTSSNATTVQVLVHTNMCSKTEEHIALTLGLIERAIEMEVGISRPAVSM